MTAKFGDGHVVADGDPYVIDVAAAALHAQQRGGGGGEILVARDGRQKCDLRASGQRDVMRILAGNGNGNGNGNGKGRERDSVIRFSSLSGRSGRGLPGR